MPTSLPLVSELLGSLKEPLYVEDPEDLAEVMLALFDAWDLRAPAHSVDTEVLMTGRDSSVVVVTIAADACPEGTDSDDEWHPLRLARSRAARLNPQDDPWEAWQLAYQRASSVWRLVPRVRPSSARSVERLLSDI